MIVYIFLRQNDKNSAHHCQLRIHAYQHPKLLLPPAFDRISTQKDIFMRYKFLLILQDACNLVKIFQYFKYYIINFSPAKFSSESVLRRFVLVNLWYVGLPKYIEFKKLQQQKPEYPYICKCTLTMMSLSGQCLVSQLLLFHTPLNCYTQTQG